MNQLAVLNTIDEEMSETEKKIRDTAGTGNARILVAEDEDANYTYIEKLLSRAGFSLLRANNGYEAVEYALSNDDISLVMMDMKMPVMNGMEATKEIKMIKPSLPIIATTAFAISGDRETFLDAGCDDYLPKPLRAETLIDLIRIYLQ